MTDATIAATLKPQRLKDRVAIITGGGRGIGREIARLFAAHGARVLIATRTASHGEDTVRDIVDDGGTAELLTVDLGSAAAARELVATAIQHWGQLDIVVHNAGYLPYCALVETPDEEFQRVLDVNLNTGFWLLKAAYPHLKASPAGRMLFTSSLTAERNHLWGLAHYGTAKGGLNALVRGAAVELGVDGITVNAVAPGGTRSAALEASMTPDAIAQWGEVIPMGRIGEGQDIARAMLFLASDEAGYITGQTLVVDGGQSLGQAMTFGDSEGFSGQ